MGNKLKAKMRKNQCLSNYIFPIAKFVMQSLFDVYKN